MEDLDELKGRVERATRALTEREAEEQGRHSQLVSLMAALEARSLEAREATERAEARLAAVEAENEELRGLLVGLLDAVETGSRSRFADAIYALEARIAPGQSTVPEAAGSSAAPKAETDALAVEENAPEEDATEDDVSVEVADREEASEEGALAEDAADFTARLAAGCAVEDQLAQEAEALRAAAAADARNLLDRVRREADRTGDAGAEAGAGPDEPVAVEAVPDDAGDMPPAEVLPDDEQPGGEILGETADPPAGEEEWRGRRQAAS